MMKSLKKILIIFFLIANGGYSMFGQENYTDWKISILPSSVRLDPSTNSIIDPLNSDLSEGKDVLTKNWIYDGKKVTLNAARGEYISFQLVLTKDGDSILRGIQVEMSPFKNSDSEFAVEPELFLEWAVEVKAPSTGYPKASLGNRWYPDALIPFKYVQEGSSHPETGSWIYPLQLPDFNNRIDNQRSMLVWVDQYIPFDIKDAPPGIYNSSISVTIGDKTKEIPISLNIWNFALPNENNLKASLHHGGFFKGMDEEQELEVYQLFKRNRVSLMDPTYEPDLQISEKGETLIQWKEFDDRLKKYFTGEAFTSSMGYDYGPGYGEPIETFILPFDVYGKHGSSGWPAIGKPEVERNSENRDIYKKVIQEVRNHFQPMINLKKTDLYVYLNGLDESYFPEAWDRMAYYGDLFKNEYPESKFRVDGGYSEEAMRVIENSIEAWASHTINYNIDEVEKYQKMGIEDWIYGPLIYESSVNSWVGSTTFIDLPLVNERAISWSVWKYNAYSWLSWGIGAGWKHAWYDPETWKSANDGGNAQYLHKKLNGNGQIIYAPGIVPNVNGVCPSIRLKAERDGVEEYEFMRLLTQLDGNSDRVDEVVNSIINQPFGDNAIGELDVWSYDAEQWDQKRIELGRLIDKAQMNAEKLHGKN